LLAGQVGGKVTRVMASQPVPTAQRTCFVIAPIGEAGSETRKRSDQVFRHIIEPCANECGYAAIRADHIAEPGIITNQVIQQLIEAPLVVADLSERNPNVFYELAIRHALRKPLVQLIRRGEAIPFDVAGMRMVQIDHQDLDSVAEAKLEIVKQIRAIESDPTKVQSPISAAVNLDSLRRSERPQDQFLAELAASVADIRAAVARLERPPSHIPSLTFSSKPLKFYGGGESSAKSWQLIDVPHHGDLDANNWILLESPAIAKGDDPCPCDSGKKYNDCHGKTEKPA
jgi:hypothetical protein